MFNPFNRSAQFNRYAPFKPPSTPAGYACLPRTAAGDEGEANNRLNGLNSLSCLNQKTSITPALDCYIREDKECQTTKKFFIKSSAAVS
jgi:hypothetical protein